MEEELMSGVISSDNKENLELKMQMFYQHLLDMKDRYISYFIENQDKSSDYIKPQFSETIFHNDGTVSCTFTIKFSSDLKEEIKNDYKNAIKGLYSIKLN